LKKEIKPQRGRPVLTDEQKVLRNWYKPFIEAPTGKRRRNLYWTPARISELGDVMIDWFEANHTKVSLGAFCWQHKIPPSYLGKFSKKNPYFDYCIQVIKALLESRLLEMGLAGEIDRVMAIFSLKNIAGWTDKREVSSTLEVTSKVIELQLPKKVKPIEVKAEIVTDKPRRNANA